MSWRIFAMTGIIVGAGALGGVVYAQFADTKSASGSVNATSASTDLYICEPKLTSGPACGQDDSDADETIFESIEDVRPGAIIVQDLRLKNVGAQTWTVSSVVLDINEIEDPGADCPDGVLGNLPGAS